MHFREGTVLFQVKFWGQKKIWGGTKYCGGITPECPAVVTCEPVLQLKVFISSTTGVVDPG